MERFREGERGLIYSERERERDIYIQRTRNIEGYQNKIGRFGETNVSSFGFDCLLVFRDL